ncbi:degenerin mec-10-like [Ruditapes philippinarum]|uniref:degenerin mec-10-like n=1 Tax=Ruditapes philippinarum TaxID=129788 RepID=UPI00295A877A|nr:degenerin mec-10-like [Ruditapes philippinarum]
MPEDNNMKALLKELGETSSLHGIPKIVSSRQIVVKALWCLLLLGTMTAFAIQLHGLFEEFYSFPTKTSVRLDFKPLAFPALTFCNMNPIRFSQIAKYENIKKVIVGKTFADYKEYFDYESLENYDENILQDHSHARDTFHAWKSRFLTEYRKLSAENKSNAGHQRKDFIHSAVFSGHRMKLSIFEEMQSHLYGNCYTLDEDKLIARGSGHKNSLYIVFNIETAEYLHDITSAYGVRMVLHERGTFPLPEDEGLTLSSQFETHIGLRLTRVVRLGGKFGDCTDGHEFKMKYKIEYTVPICYTICETEYLQSMCNCRSVSSLNLVGSETLRFCDYDEDEGCVEKVIDNIHDGKLKCDCPARCKENVFSTTFSSRQWPHKKYLKSVILEEICNRNTNITSSKQYSEMCNNLIAVTDEDLDQIAPNFLAVYIYFEDLNYETISEEPLYNTIRFLSDIGGAMGLYMGASVLTYVELLQVALEVFLLVKRKMKQTSPVKDKIEN